MGRGKVGLHHSSLPLYILSNTLSVFQDLLLLQAGLKKIISNNCTQLNTNLEANALVLRANLAHKSRMFFL